MPATSQASSDDRLPLAAVCLMWAATAAAVGFMHWGTIDGVPLPDENVLRMWRARG